MKIDNLKSVTDGYTRPLCVIKVNMKNSLIKIFMALNLLACVQNRSSDNQASSNKEFNKNVKKPLENPISKFIPDGYSVLDSVTGNLNLDKHNDLVLVLKKNDEEKTSNVIDNPVKRPLLILNRSRQRRLQTNSKK